MCLKSGHKFIKYQSAFVSPRNSIRTAVEVQKPEDVKRMVQCQEGEKTVQCQILWGRNGRLFSTIEGNCGGIYEN